jgi:GH15 family glucan-1,4-alpha-glucosidase
MGQVQEDRSFLREWWTKDGEPRRTRFKGVDDQPVTLPAVVKHLGRGAVVASLPPGNWTYSWIRDGAYATVAMALLGMKEAARASLLFYLRAEAGRFKDWQELSGYGMPKYQITLVRYYGFGVEETDFNSYGPNLEFDGFGLFLWTLRAYERLTGDTSVADEHWPLIAGEVGDVLVALVDPMTGLIRRDSSIWETHWEGRERYFAYTSITAVRGLCDAAAIAERIGDTERGHYI